MKPEIKLCLNQKYTDKTGIIIINEDRRNETYARDKRSMQNV